MRKNLPYVARSFPNLIDRINKDPELFRPFLSRIRHHIETEPPASPSSWGNFWKDTIAVGTLLSGVSSTFAAIQVFQNKAEQSELRKENSEQRLEIEGLKKQLSQIERFRSEATKELGSHGVSVPGTDYKVGFFKESKHEGVPKEKAEFPEEKPKGPKV